MRRRLLQWFTLVVCQHSIQQEGAGGYFLEAHLMNTTDIRGKWAPITGASRGIGKQVSLGLADYGCNVIVHSRDTSHTNQLADSLTAKGVKVLQVAVESVMPGALVPVLIDDGTCGKLFRAQDDVCL